MWLYLTEDWLRLAIPSETDSNQTRWLNHPLWDAISNVFNQQQPDTKLKRFSTTRVPDDGRLFVHGLGGLTSFMAREGMDDLGEGIGEFFQRAKEFYKTQFIDKHDKNLQGIEAYINRKVKSKNRRFNSINNRKNNLEDKHQINVKAIEYRSQSDGDE